MALINSYSHPVIRGQADIFSIPSTDTTTETSFYVEYKPLVNIQDSDAKIEFRVVGNPNQYLDLSDSFLHVRVKLVASDNTDLPAGVDVSTANLFIHSLFSQCDVSINNQLISSSNNCYAYKAYLETILNYGKDYINSQGTCALYYVDTSGGVADNSNAGYLARKKFVASSKSLEMIDKLRFDLASQQKYILNDTNVNICLTRSSDTFCLLYKHSGTASDPVLNPKVKFLDASLFVKKHVLYPSIVLSHQKLLEGGQSARYAYKKSDLKFFTIPSGNQSFTEENLFLGTIPLRVILCLVPSSAFNGDYLQNPFRFDHHDLNYVSLTVNNIPIPIKGLNLNFTDNAQCLLPYYMLFNSLGMAGQDQGLTFDRLHFGKGNCFLSFDLSQAAHADSLMQLEKSGTVRIELKFHTALKEAINCIVYSEHQNVLEINRFRQVSIH